MIAAADWDAERAFARYESLRAHLPPAPPGREPATFGTLAEIANRYDAFVLDAFGVLNVGATPIPGAVERMGELRGLGKGLVVLTNAASVTRAEALEKYHRLGFDFAPEEVVSSRDLAAAAVAARPEVGLWAAITGPGGRFGDIPAEVRALDADAGLLEWADGFLFLGSESWTPARQAALVAALRSRPRPLVVANPDVVAPRETGFSLEPGHFAHEIAAAAGIVPEFHGKPYGGAFAEALRRLPAGTRPERVAMVGDTLHTDVLGGRAAGLGTVLVAAHGLFKGHDPRPFMARSGIWPHALAETT